MFGARTGHDLLACPVRLPPMTGRSIDVVRVVVGGVVVAIPWGSHEALLEKMPNLDALAGVRDAFTGVGTSRPVERADADKAKLVGVIDGWESVEPLPEGVAQLRDVSQVSAPGSLCP